MRKRQIARIVMIAGGLGIGANPPSAWADHLERRVEIAQLRPSDADQGGGGGFGRSVSISGDHIAVGANRDSSGDGAVYVFVHDGTTWVEEAKLSAEVPEFNDELGTSVDIDGDLVVAGAPHFDPAGGDFGEAIVFRREESAWVQEARLIPSGSQQDDSFGWDLSISGELVAVGAPSELPLGRVYVFRREGTSWVEEASLVPADIQPNNGWGAQVSISGDTLVAGATGDDDLCPSDPDCNSGAVYVFRRQGTTWVQEAKLKAPDAQASDVFGSKIVISDQTVVVGVIPVLNPPVAPGSAYVYRRIGNAWTLEGKLLSPDPAPNDRFGGAVAKDTDVIVIGEGGDDEADPENQTCDSGAAHVFRRNNDTWTPIAKLIASDPVCLPGFGGTIAVSGELAVIGTGIVRIYNVAETAPAIPTISAWGLAALVLLLVGIGKIVFRGHDCRPPLHCLIWVMVLPGLAIAQAPDFGAPHHPEHLLVGFKPGADGQARQLAHAAGAPLL